MKRLLLIVFCILSLMQSCEKERMFIAPPLTVEQTSKVDSAKDERILSLQDSFTQQYIALLREVKRNTVFVTPRPLIITTARDAIQK